MNISLLRAEMCNSKEFLLRYIHINKISSGMRNRYKYVNGDRGNNLSSNCEVTNKEYIY